MTIDAYTVIAAARARGLGERTIARQLGLRDGEAAYGITRQDFATPAPVERLPVIRRVEPPSPPPVTERPAHSPHKPSIRDWLVIVADVSGVSVEKLTGQNRQRCNVVPRQIGMHLALKHTGASLTAIGRIFLRDHTVVLHADRCVNKYLADGDAWVAALIKRAEARLISRADVP